MPLDPISQTTCPIPLRLGAVRGDSIDVRLRLVSAQTGRPIVLTGWSGEAKIWASAYSDAAATSLTVTVDQAPAGQPTTGMVTISALPGATTLWLGDAFWSLVMISAGVRKTIVSGPWQLAGPGFMQASTCGLSVCSSTPLEQIGSACVVARDGYQDLILPFPQASCGC